MTVYTHETRRLGLGNSFITQMLTPPLKPSTVVGTGDTVESKTVSILLALMFYTRQTIKNKYVASISVLEEKYSKIREIGKAGIAGIAILDKTVRGN